MVIMEGLLDVIILNWLIVPLAVLQSAAVLAATLSYSAARGPGQVCLIIYKRYI